MNKAQNELLIDLFRNEIDIIFEALEGRHKQQIFEVYLLIINANLEQQALIRVSRAYGGDKAQMIIDNVNRLRNNLILQPAATDRMQQLNQLSSRVTLTAANYFLILHAAMLSYISSASQNFEVVNELTREKNAMSEGRQKAEQLNQQYMAAVTELAERYKAVEESKNNLAQERNLLQDQLAQKTQKAEQFDSVESENQLLRKELLSLRCRQEALELPLKLRSELNDKDTELQSLVEKIQQLSLSQKDLEYQQCTLNEQKKEIQANPVRNSPLKDQLKNEKLRKQQIEALCEQVHKQLLNTKTKKEFSELNEKHTKYLNECILINNTINQLTTELESEEKNKAILSVIESKLSITEKKLAELKQKITLKEEQSHGLSQEIANLRRQLEHHDTASTSAMKPSIPSANSRTDSYENSSEFNQRFSSQSSAREVPAYSSTPSRGAFNRQRPLPKTPLEMGQSAHATGINNRPTHLNNILIDQLIKPLDLDTIKDALENKRFEINTCDKDGCNLLHHTCRSTLSIRYRLAELLLKNGINTDAIDVFGNKPIQYAEKYNDSKLISIVKNKITVSTPPAHKSPTFAKNTSTLFSSSRPNGQNNLQAASSEQQRLFVMQRNKLNLNISNLEEHISLNRYKIVAKFEQLRRNSQLASYDNEGHASQTLENISLTNSGDALARLTRCAQDCIESSQSFNALYCNQFISLLLNQAHRNCANDYQYLAPMTVSQSYHATEVLQASIKDKLKSRLNCIPLHINSNHWVVLIIHKIEYLYKINYIDPFGNKMDGELRKKLQSIFGDRIIIQESCIALQTATDSINCGPYIVEICKLLKDLSRLNTIDNASLNQKIRYLKDNINIYNTRTHHLEAANQALQELLADSNEEEVCHERSQSLGR